jgi:glucan phosphoethanolaminetransferase (alkaline phosphatase superfamily)
MNPTEKMGIMHIFMLIFILMLGIYFIILASMGCVKGEETIYFLIGILVFLFMPIYLFFVVGTSINEENQVYGMIIAMIMLITCIFFIVMAAKGCVANKAAFYGIGLVWMFISAGGLFLLYQKNNLLIANKLNEAANDLMSSASVSAVSAQQFQQPMQQFQQPAQQQFQQPAQQQFQQPAQQQIQQPAQQQVGGETFIPKYKVASWL